MKKLFCLFLLGVATGIIIFQLISLARIHKLEQQDVILKVRVTTEFINVRKQANSSGDRLYEAVENDVYEVIEIYDGDYNYMWYKIIFSDRRTGWIASSKTAPWVEEIRK